MMVGTEQEYRRRRTVNFVGLWTKVIGIFCIVLVAVYVGVNTFFNVIEKDIVAESNNLTIQLNQQKFDELQTQVTKFNNNLSNIIQVQQQTKDWSGFFRWWLNNGEELGIQKFVINSLDSLISFRGRINTEEKMLDFKTKMETYPNFSNVEIPLSSVIKQKNGVEFNLNFKINKLP